jgi:protease-4
VYHNAIKSVKSRKRKDYNKVSIFDYEKMTTTGVSTDSKIKLPLSMRREKFKVERRCQHYRRGSMRRSLQDARRNKDVKAIVLRIDPGGALHQI